MISHHNKRSFVGVYICRGLCLGASAQLWLRLDKVKPIKPARPGRSIRQDTVYLPCSQKLTGASLIYHTESNKKLTSASVKLTQTRNSHSKQLFHGAQISQGFYTEGQKLETYNRKFPFESNLESNRRIVVYSFSVTFFDCHIQDESKILRDRYTRLLLCML